MALWKAGKTGFPTINVSPWVHPFLLILSSFCGSSVLGDVIIARVAILQKLTVPLGKWLLCIGYLVFCYRSYHFDTSRYLRRSWSAAEGGLLRWIHREKNNRNKELNMCGKGANISLDYCMFCFIQACSFYLHFLICWI